MKNKGRFFFLVLVLFAGISFVLPFVAQAAPGVPEILIQQGRLLDSGGNLLGGTGTNYCFRFSVWDVSTGGTRNPNQLWPSAFAVPSTMTIEVKSGVFSAGIGDTVAGGDTLNFNFQDNDTVYLNVEIAAQSGGSCAGVSSFETPDPRQRIGAAGYALNANTVGGFTPAQSATGSQIPVLSSGNLALGGTNPQLNVTGGNTLTLQGGAGTGAIQFFSSANNITSAGALTIAGGLTSTSATIGVAGTATGTLLLKGTTSGTVTLTTADAAGTYTLTLPTAVGGGRNSPYRCSRKWGVELDYSCRSRRHDISWSPNRYRS
ncbi:MAG: hypothetical protein Q8P55_01295 [bacterium]|nr:hypothetical protein [bacterium]